MEEQKKRKTTTSTAVKAKYNKKTYTPITAYVSKDTAEAFKEKCKEKNIPQAQIIKKAIEDFLNDL